MDNKKFLIPTIIFAAATGFYPPANLPNPCRQSGWRSPGEFRNMELLKNGSWALPAQAILLLIIILAKAK